MTPEEQQDVDEVLEISDRAFVDCIELIHLIAVMEGQNNGVVNTKLSEAGAADAAIFVRNSLLSRIVIFVAGAYAPARVGDLHLRRAFDLLNQPAVRHELGQRGWSKLIGDAVALWTGLQSDPRLKPIIHFRNKFTAHSSRPEDIPLPLYAEVFGLAADTITIADTLARGTGARIEPLGGWQKQAQRAASKFWAPWS